MTRRKISDPSNPLIDELTRFIEHGMKREAFRTIRKILSQPRIEPIEFTYAMNALETLGSMTDLQKSRELVEKAYTSQSRKNRQAMKSDMLRYYGTLKDWENALSFITAKDLKSAVNAVFVMELLLETKRLTEAKRLANNCKRLLQKKQDRFTFALLVEALAVYSARNGDWDKALNLWHQAPLDQPCQQNALCGIVRIHLARALQSVNTGLQFLDRLKKQPDQESGPTINHEALTSDAEKELLLYKRHLEKLLPLSRRLALGFPE